MKKVNITYKGFPTLYLEFQSNKTTDKLFKIISASNINQKPISRDQKRYTVDYLNQLAKQVEKLLGWNWNCDQYTYEQTTRLHKNIERLAGPDFSTVPQEFHHLIHEIHYCLHAVEQGQKRGNFLQVEWFNSLKAPLEETFAHKKSIEFGDVRLQNPYVGHTPLMVWTQNDSTNLMQTCKFHDRITPGIYISIEDTEYDFINYKQWWEDNGRDFVDLHGWDKIWHYTGHAVVGKVINLDDLTTISNTDQILELEKIEIIF